MSTSSVVRPVVQPTVTSAVWDFTLLPNISNKVIVVQQNSSMPVAQQFGFWGRVVIPSARADASRHNLCNSFLVSSLCGQVNSIEQGRSSENVPARAEAKQPFEQGKPEHNQAQ
jgi:hypothetical protein